MGMKRTARFSFVALFFLASSCGSGDSSGGTIGPEGSADQAAVEPSTTVVPDQADDATEDVTIEVFTTGGSTNLITVPVNSHPELVVDADGVAWRSAPERDFGAMWPELERKELSSATLMLLAERIGQDDVLFDPESDFGSTDYNDQLPTQITITIDGVRQTVGVYDLYNEAISGDPALRPQIWELLDSIGAIIEDDAAPWEPAMTETVLVLASSDEEGRPASHEWPPDVPEPDLVVTDEDEPARFRCSPYSGANVDTLAVLAEPAEGSEIWDLPSGPQRVFIRPVFFEPDCDRALVNQ